MRLRRTALFGALLLSLAACDAPGPDAPGGDRALVLDGEAWVDFGDPGDRFDMPPDGERTYALWLRYTRPQYHAKILDKTRTGTSEQGMSVFVHQYSTALGFWHQGGEAVDSTGFTKDGTAGTRRIGDGAWHHVAIVQRGPRVEGWVDGRLDFVEEASESLDGLATDGALLLGWNGEDIIRFAGAVDELTIWDRALSRRDLRRLMYDRPAPDAPGLAAYWPMDGRRPDVVRDLTPWGQDGTGVGLSREPASRPLAPPFTQRPAFFVLLGLLFLAMAYGVLRLYGLRLTRQKKKLERQVEERVRDLARTNAEKDAALAVVASQAQRLEELDQARRRFFANISHEFRTPLSLIVGPLGDLARGRRGQLDADTRRAVQGALRNGRRLRHLTEQLLDLARLESGVLRLRTTGVDLSQLIADLVKAFRPAADEKEIRLDLEVPGIPVLLQADPQRLETIFTNLLSNAFRFSPQGGRVAVTLTRGGAWAVVEVRDEGPGIPADQAERIFERFYQTSGGSASGGTGIGLALVRELTELHGGTVALGRATGPGALFRVELPVSLPAESESTEPLERWVPSAGNGAYEPAWEPPPEDGRQEGVRSEPVAPGNAASDDADRTLPPLVLVVEDHGELRSYVEGHLSREFRVVAVADGRAALERARAEPPDVVVSDVMMPEMDGLELLSELRADAELDTVPVVLLTARSELEDRLRGFRKGADDYLAKPFEPEELTARVRSLVEQRMRLRRRFLEGGVPGDGVPGDGGDGPPSTGFEAQLRWALEERLADPDFGVSELAACVAMERTGLYRRMVEELDTTPSDFMREARMSAAARLLEEGNTVAEVAYAVGYGSVSSFSRRFKERFGATPGSWDAGRSREMSAR